MGLLKSANNVPGVDLIDYRDQTYYNKYEYRARVSIQGLRRAYYSDPDEFEERVRTNSFYGKLKKDELDLLKQNMPGIKQLLQFKKDKRKDKSLTIRMEYDTMAVFHNDLQFLHDTFDNVPGITVNYTQVETTGYAGIKTFAKEPKHKYRVYFKSRRISEEFKESISKILSTNKELRPSPALKIWLSAKFNQSSWKYWAQSWLSSAHFIDYNEESYLSYLHLMHGEMLGKKYKLEKRPDID
jgi:hypothetical protein